MHRQTQYAYEVPSETDFLYGSRFAYEALGLLAADLLGTTTLAAGLACTPTGPPSLQVNISPGRIYSFQNLEPTAWGVFDSVGGLNADTNADHQILKQGLFHDTTAFSCPAPGTSGFSINYLIEASFSEVDAIPISLPFVSATSPYPPIAPNTLDTVRQDNCVITVKAGTAATTGTQTTPSVDSGNVGLWVVTVAHGATTIVSGNISAYSPSSFISETLTQKISQAFADGRYLQISSGSIADTGAANAYVIAPSPALTARVVGQRFNVKWANANAQTSTSTGAGVSTINDGLGVIALKNAYGIDIPAGDIQPGSFSTIEWDGTDYRIIESRSRNYVLSTSGNGFAVLFDNGLMIQAINASAAGGNTGIVSLPLTFPRAIVAVIASAEESTTGAATTFCSASAVSTSQVRAQVNISGFSVCIIAVGF